MVIFNSYVKLPEGIYPESCCFQFYHDHQAPAPRVEVSMPMPEMPEMPEAEMWRSSVGNFGATRQHKNGDLMGCMLWFNVISYDLMWFSGDLMVI